MTANKELMYWHTNNGWYGHDEESDWFFIRDDAPERAKKSFRLWCEGWGQPCIVKPSSDE